MTLPAWTKWVRSSLVSEPIDMQQWARNRDLAALLASKNKLRSPPEQIDADDCVVILNGQGRVALVMTHAEWKSKPDGWAQFLSRRNYTVESRHRLEDYPPDSTP